MNDYRFASNKECDSPKQKYGRKRLAVLNMMHSQKLLDISSSASPTKRNRQTNIALSSPTKNPIITSQDADIIDLDDDDDDEINFLAPKQHQHNIKKSLASLPKPKPKSNFSIKMDFNSNSSSSSGIKPPSNIIVPSSKLGCLKRQMTTTTNSDEKKVSKRALRLKLMECSALLRCDFETNLQAYESVKTTIQHLIEFLADLKSIAKHKYETLEGKLFQELLNYTEASSSSDRKYHNENLRIEKSTIEKLVPQVELLIKTLRIKIEDDNDLNLARKALRETQEALTDVVTYAKQKDRDEFELVQALLKH